MQTSPDFTTKKSIIMKVLRFFIALCILTFACNADANAQGVAKVVSRIGKAIRPKPTPIIKPKPNPQVLKRQNRITPNSMLYFDDAYKIYNGTEKKKKEEQEKKRRNIINNNRRRSFY